MSKKILFWFWSATIAVPLLLCSCSTAKKLQTTKVCYQSVQNLRPDLQPIPETAKIITIYTISDTGGLNIIVKNNTSGIIVVDKTKSFFISPDGTATSLYDPTIKTTTVTDLSSSTTGSNVNLGAVASALGIGGPVGTLMSGINVGESSTSGTSVTNTSYSADIPKVAIGPKGAVVIASKLMISGVGKSSLSDIDATIKPTLSKYEAVKFSTSIYYSTDDERTYDQLTSNFATNSLLVVPILQDGKVNTALTEIFRHKPDALTEPWYLFYFHNNLYSNRADDTLYETNGLYDYQ